MKSLLLGALAHERVFNLTAAIGPQYATVFVGHRFANVEEGITGHNPVVLDKHLALLRRHKFNLVPLTEIVRRLQNREQLQRRTVAFTFDDGYADYIRAGAPVFEAYDCPVTVFLTTGFVDGQVWMWWDQIAYVILRTAHRELDLIQGTLHLRERWTERVERTVAAERIAETLKTIPNSDKWNTIAVIADQLEVTIPASPPPEFAPMTWDEIRACERGVTAFGPHTVTHPILTRIGKSEAAIEVSNSWERLKHELDAPVPIFCYPNGTEDTFTDRDIALVRRAGLKAAVTTEAEYVSHGGGARRMFRIPRFGYPEPGDAPGNERQFRHIVGGIERGKAWLRRVTS